MKGRLKVFYIVFASRLNRPVIDTNVIVSAYITKNLEAATSKLWEAVLQCKLTPIYNEEILSEYSEVLRRKKFGIPEHLIKWALDKIVTNGVRGERVLSDEFFPDPKDVVFYEVALRPFGGKILC